MSRLSSTPLAESLTKLRIPVDPAVALRAANCPAAQPPSDEVAQRSGTGSLPRLDLDLLLIATASGDRQAFKSLYQHTSARVFAVVRRVVWARGEAEEVVQDIFLKIWGNASCFDPAKAHALTWMLRVARNHAIDHLRRDAGRKAHERAADDQEDVDSLGECPTAIDASIGPEESLQRVQDQHRFDLLLENLPPSTQQVLVMAFRGGLTQAEIALQFDAPLGTVKSWMRRGLQELKIQIEQQDAQQRGRDA